MKIDEYLTWKDHLTNIKGTWAGRLIELWKERKSMSKEASKTVVNATVISEISYCDIVYASATSTNLQKVQQIQNFAARVIHRVPRRNHISELIIQLDWMKTDKMRDFHHLSLIYKCLSGMSLYIYLKILTIIKILTVIIQDKRIICMCQCQLRRASIRHSTIGAFKIPTHYQQYKKKLQALDNRNIYLKLIF